MAENPYLIEDADDLAAFRDIVNGTGDYSGAQNRSAHAKLTDNINLNNESWTPIGDYGYQYIGTFDGCGHTITGLTINSSSNVCLFGYVGSGGTVKNLTLENVSVNSSRNDSSSGGVVGYNRGAVSNCVVSGNVSGKYHTGGVVGSNRGTVSNCVFSGNVSGRADTTGVVVGWNNGTVSNCGYLSGSTNKPIGYGNGGTNVGSFSSEDEMDKIAVTLSASIENSEIAADGETTITLTTQPGEWADVMSANGLAVTGLSDNSGLVTITDNGDGTLTVKGNGNTGETTITVTAMLYTYNYSSGTYETDVATTYPFNFDLTVNDVEVREITLSDSSLEMTVGESRTLTVSYEPDDTTQKGVMWSTDNENVVIITSNTDTSATIEAVGVGDAKITATSTEDGTISATCEITVTETTDTESGGASGGSGGGGCNAGTGALALLALIPLAMRRKR